MALLKSIASGDFTSASTWAVCTAVLDSNIANPSTVNSTSYTFPATTAVYSSTSTATGVLVKGICGSGATSTYVYQSGDTVTVAVADASNNIIAGTEVTMSLENFYGIAFINWRFFKFVSPVSLTNGASYKVAYKVSRIFSSVSAGVTICDNYAIVTSATKAPAANDQFLIVGDNTGNANPALPGSKTATFTVLMNNTATTTFGSNTGANSTFANLFGLFIDDGCIMNYGTNAATNYTLNMAGHICIGNTGTLTIGTVANPIPINSTATLALVYATTGRFNFYITGKLIAQGQPRTTGKEVSFCKLTSNVAIGATVLNVDTDTGWLAGDTIGIAPTGRGASANTLVDTRTLSINASANTLTVSSGLTYAHDGNTDIQAAVVNLTRNVVIRATTTSTNAGFFIGFYNRVASLAGVQKTDLEVDCDWVQFDNIGATDSISLSLYALRYPVMETSFQITNLVAARDARLPAADKTSFDHCSFRGQAASQCKGFTPRATTNSFGFERSDAVGISAQFTNCVFYQMGIIYTYYTTPDTLIKNCVGIYTQIPATNTTESRYPGTIHCGGTLTIDGVTIAGAYLKGITYMGDLLGNFNSNVYIKNCIIYSVGGNTDSGAGITIGSYNTADLSSQARRISFGTYDYSINIDNCKVMRCYYGIVIGLSTYETLGITKIRVNNLICVGNTDHNFRTASLVNNFASADNYYSSSYIRPLVISNSIFGSQTGYSSAIGCSAILDIDFINTQFGTGTGVSGHTTSDLRFLANDDSNGLVYAYNCLFNSVTLINGASNLQKLISENHNQVSGSRLIIRAGGSITNDNVIKRTGVSSIKLIPNSASVKNKHYIAKIAAKRGTSPTIGIYIRKSVLADGATYNGSQPRIVLLKNFLLGIEQDTVIATATNAANGSWELVSGTISPISYDAVLEIYVDCDGTAGWVNYDDLVLPNPVETLNLQFIDETTKFSTIGNNQILANNKTKLIN